MQKQIHILIVEDDSDHRELLKANLESYGYCCHEAVNGIEGLTALTRRFFDGVICDYHMPFINGIQFIEKARMTRSLGSLPIIFMTGHSDPAILQKALNAGATTTLLKPIIHAELQTALRLLTKKIIPHDPS